MQNEYVVLLKLVHEQNSSEGNEKISCQTIKANSYGEVELKIKTDWAKLKCNAEIIQITMIS